jgi:mono/diheme cytochrome c family protein
MGVAVAFVAFAQTPEPRTIRDGVFSAAQVERGRRVFTRVCADCHEIEEFTGVGAYLEEMEGETVWEVFEYVWAEMPEDYPSSLEPEQYADVLSYIFSVYGLAAGEDSLPIERAPLESIVITRPERPGS